MVSLGFGSNIYYIAKHLSYPLYVVRSFILVARLTMITKESLPYSIEREVISTYTIKSNFDEIKKTYSIES